MGKEGEDKMTVIVPPPNSSKLNAEPGKDKEGDANMTGTEEGENGADAPVDPRAKTIADIKANFVLLEKAVTQFDARFSLRVLRSISSSRKHLSRDLLADVISDTYSSSSPVAQILLSTLEKPYAPTAIQTGSEMEVDGQRPSTKAGPKDIIPEIDTYISILIQVMFYDSKDFEPGAKFSTKLVERLRTLNRRTLDPLAAKVYFYYSLCYEQLHPLPPSQSSPVISVRPVLLAALRTAVLRKDQDTQAAVTTLLLRNYLSTSNITQADLLISHSQFPSAASNNQIARYLYYLGRIRAIQLSYTEAHEHLVSATRKSPSSHSAGGFYQASTKLLIIVELLMGDIPDRATFRQNSLEHALQPYLQLVQAVRVGDLENFLNIVKAHNNTFRKDGTYTLILRLRQNVIKTGIRMMSLSYSRISLRDICLRLGLRSEETAEYIVAKAIRDGVIEANLDHENGYMKSKEVGDVYSTREPGEAFHERIRACLDLHDESVKAMRFPMNQHRLELKNAQEARERERELAKEIVDGEMDDDDAGGDFEGIEYARTIRSLAHLAGIRAADDLNLVDSASSSVPTMLDPALRLRRAIEHGDVVLVRRIAGANPRSIRAPDLADKANTALHLAARLGHTAIVEHLITAGHEAEGVSRNEDGATPLLAAVDAAKEPAAELLAAAFPRCIAWRDNHGVDAVMAAARSGCASLIASFLAVADDRAALLAATDADGNAALHHASANGHLKCVMVLLQAGADPGARNAANWQPVSYSSTVSAEVYYKQMVAELEKRKGIAERDNSSEWRRDGGGGGVRMVPQDDDDWEAAGVDAAKAALAGNDTGRASPVGMRSPGRTVGRLRTESSESRRS